MRYLSNSYAPATFWPDDPIHRAGIDKWAEWSKINIALGFTAPIFWRVVRTAPGDRDQKAIRAGIQNFEAKLEIAEQQLSRFPFLTGDNFTLADIQFGHVLYRYFDINIDRCDFPSLEKYYKALCQRAAYKEHVMLSYDELRVEY